MSELKPCPFCGEKNVFCGEHYQRNGVWDDGPLVYQCRCGAWPDYKENYGAVCAGRE